MRKSVPLKVDIVFDSDCFIIAVLQSGAVESCLQYGLRKRSLGLFKNSNTTALLQKVAKTFDPAASIVLSLTEAEKNLENARY